MPESSIKKIPNAKEFQMSAWEALESYSDWLLDQQITEPVEFFKCYHSGRLAMEWYMIFYPVRTLLLAGKLLKKRKYIDAAVKYVDNYLTEQLPNGGFTSNYRQKPTADLSKREFHELLRTGKINIADVGSNATAIIQAAGHVDKEKRRKYLDAVRKWFDNWVCIWALKDGGYGNGIWQGHKINAPYTCAMSTVSMALSAFTLATGEREYVENAERCMVFQCSKWLEDGRPIFMNCYPLPRETILEDLGHSFYLLEGMCWTHYASRNSDVRELIEKRMREWIFGKKGLLSQWSDSWFNFTLSGQPPMPDEMLSSRCGMKHGWELAKSNGIIHTFIYYLNHIEENPQLKEKIELGLRYLSNPLMARMSGVASDPEQSYGAFALQATGFAGLSLAESLKKDSVFDLK